MILGNEAIKLYRESNQILIEPFNEFKLQGNSYDVSLDDVFVEFDPEQYNNSIDLTNWDPKRAAKCVKGAFWLQAGRRCLARTFEKIGSQSTKVVPMIASKSSWARSGLEVCSCAGFGDCGYADHWTLEIFNKNRFSVVLKPGMIIAQVYFQEVYMCSKLYQSKYNSHELPDVEKMLPKRIKVKQ
jgi:dCTP deaminase